MRKLTDKVLYRISYMDASKGEKSSTMEIGRDLKECWAKHMRSIYNEGDQLISGHVVHLLEPDEKDTLLDDIFRTLSYWGMDHPYKQNEERKS